MSVREGQSGSELPVQATRSVAKYRDGQFLQTDDVVASEYALTIFVNDNELATIVCTPTHLRQLVIGFLASEGIIRQAAEVSELNISQYMGTARVKTAHPVTFNQEFYNKRYIASCCGKSRQSFYFHNDAVTAKHVDDDVTLHAPDVFLLLDAMDANAELFHLTGGVHVAALCDTDGVIFTHTDIGRHNALDKIYGAVLESGLSLRGKVIAFSGRISSEVLLKVAKIGVGIVVARSAPTALALDIADELGITAVGFVRDKTFNVYTHQWRIVDDG